MILFSLLERFFRSTKDLAVIHSKSPFLLLSTKLHEFLMPSLSVFIDKMNNRHSISAFYLVILNAV